MKSVTATRTYIKKQLNKHDHAKQKDRAIAVQALSKVQLASNQLINGLVAITQSDNVTPNEKYYKIEKLVMDYLAAEDQTLETAFKVSCVWCYQEIARKVGTEHYERVLARLDYGNHTIGEQVDTFWLDGSLEVSAVEQIAFLRKLYDYDLPFRREHVDVLRQMMVTRHSEQYTLYAKTGWAGTEPQVAWYVGFVEAGTGTWIFAMNMRVDRPEQAALREQLSLRSLRALGII